MENSINIERIAKNIKEAKSILSAAERSLKAERDIEPKYKRYVEMSLEHIADTIHHFLHRSKQLKDDIDRAFKSC